MFILLGVEDVLKRGGESEADGVCPTLSSIIKTLAMHFYLRHSCRRVFLLFAITCKVNGCVLL